MLDNAHAYNAQTHATKQMRSASHTTATVGKALGITARKCRIVILGNRRSSAAWPLGNEATHGELQRYQLDSDLVVTLGGELAAGGR